MKGKKTLLFMLRNPAPFIGYFLTCWVMFSVLFTVSDESFEYGTLPDVVETVEGAFANLPTSIWNLVEALSMIIEEIVSEFAYYSPMCLILGIPLALIFAYREARSSLIGINTERKPWMQWFDRQQLVKTQQGTYETPPLSEYIPGDSYFISARKTVLFMFRHPILPAGHFVCWFTLFALPILFDGSGFVRSLPGVVITAAIFTLILSYREARSNLKGMAIERDIWTNWYHQQSKAIAHGNPFEEPSASENMEAYSYYGEIQETLIFMVRNIGTFVVHLMCWIFAIALLFSLTSPYKSPVDMLDLIDIIELFGQLLPWITIIVFIISYREAKGNLKGIANEQQVWMQWYHRRQETIRQGNTFEDSLPSENRQIDSYFKIAQQTVSFMMRNPLSIIVHLTCWFAGYIFPFYEIFGSAMSLIVIILALISSYQEARGTVKGAAKEGEAWAKWYQRQTEAEAEGYTLGEVPPSLKTA